MVRNQGTRAGQTRKKIPICVYWNSDKCGYEIYLAKRISGLGWIDDLYLGFARDLAELRHIMNTFGYIQVCGISSIDDLDANNADIIRDDCDPVTQLILPHCQAQRT